MDLSAESQNTSGEQSGDGQEGQPVVDYADILARQNSAIQGQSKTVDQLRRQLDESGEKFERVRKAFTGEGDEKQVSEHDKQVLENEQLMDYFLQQGLEAERSGRAIPLTVTLATKLAQANIQQANYAKKLEERLAKLEGGLERHDDPNFKLTNHAASIMEGMLMDSVDSIYGADPETERTRNAQFQAIARRIGDEIKDLQKTEPQTWDKIRRNPRLMRNMVNHFTQEVLPPQVKSILEEKKLMETEMPVEELYDAFSEAQARFESANTDRERHQFSTLMDEIRQEILSHQFGGQRQGKPSLNRILTAGR